MNKNLLLTPHLCLIAKRFPARRWSFLGSGSEKEVVLYLQRKTTRRMGQNCRANDVELCRKRTPSFPSHESIVRRKRWKVKEVENYRYTSVPMVKRSNCFFAQLFLLISSVFTEQSQKCGKNVIQGDLLWKDNRVLHSCQSSSRQNYLWIVMTLLAKILYCNKMENELKSCHNKTN